MRRSGLLGALVVALDALAVTVGLFSAHALWVTIRPDLSRIVQVQWWELWLPNPWMPPGLVLLVLWLLVLRQFDLYDPGKMTNSARIAAGVSRASFTVLVLVMLLQFLLPDRTYSRMLILGFCGLSSTVLLGLRLVFFRIQRYIPRSIVRQRVAIVGVGQDATQMADRLARHGRPYYEFAGYLRPSWDPDPQAAPNEQVLGRVPDFKDLVNAHDLHVVLLATRTASREEALLLATRADQMNMKVYQVPFNWGVASPRIDLASLGDLQLIDLTALAYPTLGEQSKRLIDLVSCSLGGLVLLPLLLCIAGGIKLQDGGPVLFVQQRMGRGGRTFDFYKFRSMVVGAETLREELEARNEADGALFKIENDPRITRLGRFLRKWSLDELPQLLNVLKGDMNLVGPRPLPMRDLIGIEEEPEIQYWMELRHKVNPGITGPWQVAGRSNLGFKEMVQHDIGYVQDWSVWLDLLILVRTVPAVLRRRGAR